MTGPSPQATHQGSLLQTGYHTFTSTPHLQQKSPRRTQAFKERDFFLLFGSRQEKWDFQATRAVRGAGSRGAFWLLALRFWQTGHFQGVACKNEEAGEGYSQEIWVSWKGRCPTQHQLLRAGDGLGNSAVSSRIDGDCIQGFGGLGATPLQEKYFLKGLN